MNRQTKIGIIITLVMSAVLFGFSMWYGKENAFLLLNTDLGPAADQFFRYWTYAGDGMIWVPIVVLVFFLKRHQTLLIIYAIIISTLIAQLSKNVFFKGIPRPPLAFTDHSLFHSVTGVELHTLNSFPSGHTTTAFTVFLLGTILIHKKWILPVGLCYALLAAYSRVYLAQHFPIDLAGGMLAAVITIWLSLQITSLQKKN